MGPLLAIYFKSVDAKCILIVVIIVRTNRMVIISAYINVYLSTMSKFNIEIIVQSSINSYRANV